MSNDIQTIEIPRSVKLPKLTLREKAIFHLNRSGLLLQYARELIIAETLDEWERSSLNLATFNIPTIEVGDRQVTRLAQYKHAKWGHLLKSRFLACQSQLNRVLFSTIEVTDLSLAQELYCRISEHGYSFNKLAILHSQNSTAKLGGVVGPILFTYLHPLIQQHLLGLKSKQLSPIFQVEDRYIFLRLDRCIPAQLNSKVEQQLIDEFFEHWLEQQIAERIGSIRLVTSVQSDESCQSETLINIDKATELSNDLSLTCPFSLTTDVADSIECVDFSPIGNYDNLVVPQQEINSLITRSSNDNIADLKAKTHKQLLNLLQL
jgi:hypothetical protein